MIYFDNSATTMPYKEAVDAFTAVSTKYFGNPSSLHGIGATAEQLLMQARKQVAKLLEVKEQEILFTSGGTEGNNMTIKGVALASRSKGRHMIVSAIEHASVMESCDQLEKLGYEITRLSPDASGRIRAEDVEKNLREDTILVSVMHVNNETGAVQPVQAIGKILASYPKVVYHVDYVQGIGKVPLSIKAYGIDLCTISAHKFHGLKGTGALYVREGVALSPLFSGGSQERKLRSGTENVAGAVSMAKALRLTLDQWEQKASRMKKISEYLRENLSAMEEVVINSPSRHVAPHILNFSVPGVKAEVLVHALEEHNIYVSTTSACSSKKKAISDTILLMTADKQRAESSIRISLSAENDRQEAEIFITVLESTLKKLKEVMR
ncbi:MAG: cysteine desulfurase family protein [Bacillus sp. (in: firmicutes)]